MTRQCTHYFNVTVDDSRTQQQRTRGEVGQWHLLGSPHRLTPTLHPRIGTELTHVDETLWIRTCYRGNRITHNFFVFHPSRTVKRRVQGWANSVQRFTRSGSPSLANRLQRFTRSVSPSLANRVQRFTRSVSPYLANRVQRFTRSVSPSLANRVQTFTRSVSPSLETVYSQMTMIFYFSKNVSNGTETH
jgi:uncharacterized membrane protein